jgi:UDPglucose--hexose-1-phosphate uridylyltransferase
MPEFRQNMATNEWVIIATERAKRPEDFKNAKAPKLPIPEYSVQCPFCRGNESKTPPPSFILEKDGAWAVRVVPNKFAAVQQDIPIERERIGRFLKASGFGIAEVIIETPLHNITLATMSVDTVRQVVSTYKQRYLEVSNQHGISMINIFRNHGERAGTSLEHPHSQLIATPIIPPHVRNPIEQAVRYHDTHGKCIYCDMVAEELNLKNRVILETDHFVAYAPFASRTPFEVRIMIKKHQGAFVDITDAELADFAFLLQNILARIYWGLDNPDYNFIIRSAPVGDEDAKYFHWYMVIIPKLTTTAGFEMGTGIYINVTYPEQCAEFLRTTIIK